MGATFLAAENSTGCEKKLAVLKVRGFQPCRKTPQNESDFTSCGKTQREGLCNKGTDFSRAEKRHKMNRALQAAEKLNSRGFVTRARL
jgi:hypothetical protein